MLSRFLLGLLAAGLCSTTPLNVDFSRRDGTQDHPELPRLKPVVRWDRDLEEWNDLVPQTAQQLYFGSDDPTERHQFADLTANFTGRAVVLQHSAFVTKVMCSPKSIEVTLANNAAYSMIETEWQAVEDFMLVTNSDSCGYLSEQFSFWDVKSLKFSPKALTVRASVDRELDIGSVLNTVKLSWGTWEPGPSVRRSHNTAPSHRLMRRGCWPWELQCIKEAAVDFAKKSLDVLSEGAQLALKYHPGIVITKKIAGKLLELWQPDVKLSIPIDVRFPEKRIDTSAPAPSKWKNPAVLKKITKGETIKNVVIDGTVGLYCVDCYLTGNINVEGRAEFNSDSGVTALYAGCNADFQGNFAIGLAAEVKIDYDEKIDIFEAAIPNCGFVVDKVISVGATVDLKAQFEAHLRAVGDLVVGVKMESCKFNTRLDMLEIEKSVKPTLEPVWKPFLDASAEISVDAGVSLPVAIGIGVTIPILKDKGKFKVQLVEKPGVNAMAEYKTSTAPPPQEEEGEGKGEGEGEEGEKEGEEIGETDPEQADTDGKLRRDLIVAREGEEECKNGIKWSVKFKNDVFAEAIFATSTKDFPLHTFEKEIAGGCFKVGGLKARADPWDPSDFDTVNDIDDDFDAAENAGDIRLLDSAIAAVEAAQLDYSDYPKDVDFIMIQDSSKQFQITQDKQGYLQPGLATTKAVPGSVWAEKDGMIWADYAHRELKFDPKSMKANGWSNIQLGPPGQESSDAESILLAPARTKVKTMPYIYLAEDLKRNAYVLLTCGYTTGGSRIFLARNPTMAAKTIKLANTKLTGGRIQGCVAQQWAVDSQDVEFWA